MIFFAEAKAIVSAAEESTLTLGTYMIEGGGLPCSPAIDAAATWGHIGLGVLIFGAAMLLVGLAVVAVRR
jgi:hypothetical protein